MIRIATRSDDDAIWRIFQAVIRPGDTYVFDPDMRREEALAYWFNPDNRTFVLEHDGAIAGTYILRPNQPALGFRAMQFNFVVSTNEPAVRLWQQLGFRIVGTLPGAFRHSTLGYVDAYVMFRELA